MADTMDNQSSSPTDSLKRLRQLVTLGALLLALAHLIWPSLAIDVITLAFVVIAILPWLAPLIKSVELPGGWKLQFQDLQKAATRAETAGLLAAPTMVESTAFSFQFIADRDPNLALAGLRIEIERRLVKIAEAHGIRNRLISVGQLLRILTEREVLTLEEQSVLSDLMRLLNAAVHGATVDSRALEWAMEVGPRLLASLDQRITDANP